MNRIKGNQLFAILIAVRMFSIICSAEPSDARQMAGAAVSIAVQLLASVPMLLLFSDSSFSLRKEMLMGKFGKILYILFFILWGAVSLSSLWEVTKSVYFPINSSLAGSLILTAVCVYTASLGIRAVSRASGFIMGLIAFCLFIMLLGAYPKADLANFTPDADFSGIIKSAVNEFCRSGELVMMFILLELTPEKRKKSITSFFAGKFILTEVIAVIEITVLGKIMGISDFPFFSAGAFSQPLSIQRADSL
ncbi:MAG: GerAB/ArcD/ProY family transporter, partial [Porcipelethomonas sp.]